MAEKDTRLRSTHNFPTETLKGSDQVLGILGYWPSFHDGIVESLHLDPSLSGTGTDIRATIRVHRMLEEVDVQGFYKLVDHSRLTFLFHNAILLSLSMDMFPDILMDFKLQQIGPPGENGSSFEVRLVSSGIIDFVCDNAEVVDVFQIADSD